MLNGAFMGNDCCSDTGPVLHLKEVDSIFLLKIFRKIFRKIFISQMIVEELSRYNVRSLPNNLVVKDVNNDQIVLISKKYDLDVGESSIIWLCRFLNINILLTDDLNAREVAVSLNIKPVGTMGIILRCFREKIINKKEAMIIIDNIQKISSLFITRELVSYIIKEIERFER